MTPIAVGQGVASAWQTVQTHPGPLVMGYITGAGGWYVLTVRAIRNGVMVAQATVQPVGIGEVFITAGQSNARGFGIGDNDLGTDTDRVSGIDTINHYYPSNLPALFSAGTPMPYATYVPLTAGKRIFPMGESSWGWAELGDYIVNRFNVPVAFYNAGWDSSIIENWNNTAHGIPACNLYYCVANWPNLQPYTNLRQVMNYYGTIGGFRAVLWHQGESENAKSSTIPLYAARLDSLIRQARQDFNGRTMPWVVARASFDGQTTTPAVVAQQNQVIQTPNFGVFEGPLNDTILNRNSGQPNVHFGNALRPTPHPRYYLNNGPSVPFNMGLSRFARNWNNSLNTSFFQTAQPILPIHFAATESVATAQGGVFFGGDSVAVKFASLGTYNAGNQWQVQVLDSRGRFKATLGIGASSPIRVRWPDSLSTGNYRVRVVSTNPVVAGAPTPMFALVGDTDVRLSSSARRRVLNPGDSTTIFITATNDGPLSASAIGWQCRLPANTTALPVSGNVSVANGIVSGTISTLGSGVSNTMAFRLTVQVAGQYLVAAEIMQCTPTDRDSQPATGTADGQDDTAQLDLRVGNSGPIYPSPNPNQVPLPALQSNQPAPVPNLADLSLRMQVSSRALRLNDLVTYTLFITNAGGATASNIGVTAYLPAGVQFVDSNDMGAGGGGISGTISSLPMNGSTSMQFRARVMAVGVKQTRAQLRYATPADPDSTPGNGLPTPTGEDDEAVVDFRVD
ncbi:sialate O-acetylesterase [Fibrella aquatilis]|uniref:sialate O-acetylesterase n=1 Tax=Fibrella aquatilis TaxID=2817059 RepID=UPI001E36F011|nr:sialate O-acetylesterase [Fibrella aquatilis]